MDRSQWEAPSFSASQEIPPPRVIWNPKVEVHCRVHNFVPILSLHRGQYWGILGSYAIKLFSTYGNLLRLQQECTEGYFAVPG